MNPTTQTPVTDELLAEVGQLVLESALMRYLVVGTEDEVAEFEAFVVRHSEEENFIEQLCAQYSGFEMILKDEVQAYTLRST